MPSGPATWSCHFTPYTFLVPAGAAISSNFGSNDLTSFGAGLSPSAIAASMSPPPTGTTRCGFALIVVEPERWPRGCVGRVDRKIQRDTRTGAEL
jgi:hypothetical protein